MSCTTPSRKSLKTRLQEFSDKSAREAESKLRDSMKFDLRVPRDLAYVLNSFGYNMNYWRSMTEAERQAFAHDIMAKY